jgi:hypothetical protein
MMSQVKFMAVTESSLVEVVAGWDRPLSVFFMTIFDLDVLAEEETIWASMFGPSQKTTEKFREKLVSMGIEPPTGFWEKVELHEDNIVYTFENERWIMDAG